MSGKVGSSLGQRCQPMLAPGTPSPGNLAPAHPAPSTQPFSPADTCSGSRRESSRRHRILELLRATRNGLSTPPKLLHPLAGSSLTAWWESRPRGLDMAGGKGRESVSAPWDRQMMPLGQKKNCCKAQQSAAQASSQLCASVSPSMEWWQRLGQLVKPFVSSPAAERCSIPARSS